MTSEEEALRGTTLADIVQQGEICLGAVRTNRTVS